MSKSKGKRRIGNPAARAHARAAASEEPIVTEARGILAELDEKPRSYLLSYYALEPHELSSDLKVPLDGALHAHGDVRGRTLHLDEERRRPTIETASRGFTAPFLAAIRRPEHVDDPVEHATIVQGANLAAEMLLNPLRVIQAAHRIQVLHFGAFLAMSTNVVEWKPADEAEMQELVADFQFRVEAEAVIIAGRHMARRGR